VNRREFLATAAATAFHSAWAAEPDQVWLGPDYWANPLQDWRLRGGRLECHVSGGDRNVFLLTRELSPRPGAFTMRVKVGRLGEIAGDGFAGFRIGIRGPFDDYRDSAVYGVGLNCGVTTDGRLFIGSVTQDAPRIAASEFELTLTGAGARLTLSAEGREVSREVAAIQGGVALVCHAGPLGDSPDPSLNVMTMSGIQRPDRERRGDVRFWFRDWTLDGPRVDAHPQRAWGPILFAQHSRSRGVMKMTAQMAPAAIRGPARLRVAGKTYEAGVDPLSRTATFRVTGWDDSRDHRYRIEFAGGSFEGTIRRDPKQKPRIVVGAVSCTNDLGFPHAEVPRSIAHFQPDLVAYTGDQIYERTASYGIERAPLERAALDYLRKWYLFGWTFRDLMRDTPSITIVDDHDVYHGNVWGAGGRKAEGAGQPGQDSGGYTQPAEWVNMVQRTQTSHLPDPVDPAPVDQGITVYFTEMLVGGVSFAILEDRKWKSAPKMTIPQARIVNGWAKNPDYVAARDGDVAGAQLLGERQMRFLDDWAKPRPEVWQRCAVSQTIFVNLATLPPPADTDAVTPKLPVQPVGGYAEGEMLVADHDSNGWPQSPRNAAVRALWKARALHIAGDQHLGSTIRYGVDDWNDCGWAVCVPAVSNLFPRRWYPPMTGKNPPKGGGRNTGEFVDGFGNKVTVHAVFNPQAVAHEPKIVHQRAPGFGIVEFDRAARTTTVTIWPRWEDPAKPGAKPVAGWPIVIGSDGTRRS
jgi:alkaline phosphatase D